MKTYIIAYGSTPWQNGQLIYAEAKRQKLEVEMGFVEWPFKHLLREIERSKPDWIFLTGSRALPPEKLAKLAKIAKLALWDADVIDTNRDEIWKESASMFDLVITSVKDVLNRFKDICKNIVWLPQFFDTQFYGPLLERAPLHDACFIGNLLSAKGEDPRRFKFLNSLRDKFDLITFGTTLATKDTNVIYGHEMTRAYSSCKISFDIKRDIHHEYIGDFIVSDRIFKAMGCGIFFISYPVICLSDIFIEDKHLVTYDGTLDNLSDKIEFYLKNEKLREQIALKGQQEILKNHTLEVRLKQYWELLV